MACLTFQGKINGGSKRNKNGFVLVSSRGGEKVDMFVEAMFAHVGRVPCGPKGEFSGLEARALDDAIGSGAPRSTLIGIATASFHPPHPATFCTLQSHSSRLLSPLILRHAHPHGLRSHSYTLRSVRIPSAPLALRNHRHGALQVHAHYDPASNRYGFLLPGTDRGLCSALLGPRC
jgi:hypothetical protein